MGNYSDNYYSYMYKLRSAKIALDAASTTGNGYKHPNGTPCRASSIDTCPYYRADEHIAYSIDMLDKDKVGQVERGANNSEYSGIVQGIDPESPNVRPVAVSDLSTFSGGTKSKFRGMRNKLFDFIKHHGVQDGTYPLEDIGEDATKESVEAKAQYFNDGFQVSFQTTNGEGFNHESNDLTISDADYDKTVEELSKATGSKPYLGVFGGIPEVSFKAKTFEQAMDIAKRFNQVSICDNKKVSIAVETDDWSDPMIFPSNPNYDWTENQTFMMKNNSKED